MRFEGICPRCKSEITIDVTQINTDVVHDDESHPDNRETSGENSIDVSLFGCYAYGPLFGIEEPYETKEENSMNIYKSNRSLFGCSADRCLFDMDEEYTGHEPDEIIVQCPICDTIVRARSYVKRT